MDELEVWRYYDPVTASRDTRKKLARIEQAAIVRRQPSTLRPGICYTRSGHRNRWRRPVPCSRSKAHTT